MYFFKKVEEQRFTCYRELEKREIVNYLDVILNLNYGLYR